MEVRSTQGIIVSTKTLPVGKNKEKFSDDRVDCPLCGKPYFKQMNGKEKKILYKSIKTGQEFFI
jgi:hypothetical protein